MKWLNAQYLREFSLEEFNGLAVPFYEKSKVKGKYDYLKLSGLLQNRVEILSEIPGMIDFWKSLALLIPDYMSTKMKTDAAVAKRR